jgi:dynein heavy chain
VETTKNKVDRFRRTMPLVNDLHNKSMRERHWKQIKVKLLLNLENKKDNTLAKSLNYFLKDESNKQFEENSDEFTLEVIIDLHFEENATLISEVSEAASKEFDIEKVNFFSHHNLNLYL